MTAPELTQVKETCLYVTDLEATRQFYHNVMGLPVLGYSEGRHIFFRIGRDVLLCFISSATTIDSSLPAHDGSGQLHVAFECPEKVYDLWKTYLTEQGIPIEHEVNWGNDRYSFYFRDPDNHCLEIIMPGVWE
jgi:catechol 2,3-dioxygenase-like lactoylglutathione lyase family enzyme